ncbi:MAG: hydrogenase maturation nickel metallochaperone HypA [Gammaproteobacteria bacterium]
MHEMSLCEGVLQVIKDQARSQHFVRVRRVRLEIGVLACVEPEAMRFSFDAVTHGTLAHGANLEIITVPGEAWCMRCARTRAVNRRYDECQECGSVLLQLTRGEELRIKDLEVE